MATTKQIVDTLRSKHSQRRTGQINSKCRQCAGVLVLTIVVFGRASCAWAQNQPPRELTLRQAVQLALRQNPEIQIASLSVTSAEQAKKVSFSSLLPQAKIQAGEAYLRENRDVLLGFKTAGGPTILGPFQVVKAGITGSMPIFDASLVNRYQAAKYEVSAAGAQARNVRERIILQVISQYLACLRTNANVRALQSRVELAETLYRLAADLQDNGAGTGIDTLRANVQLQNEKQQLIVAEAQDKTSLFGLKRLLNVDSGQDLVLADEISFFETPEFTVEASLEQAYASRPELKGMEASLNAARKNKDAAWTTRLPSLRAEASWAYQGLSVGSSVPVYSYEAGISIPLFTGGRIKAEVASAELQQRNLMQQRQDIRNQIALDVNTATVQLNAARHEVEVAKLGLKLAQEEVLQSRDRFHAGVANNVEVVQAQDELARASDGQINALYRYNQARADLAQAIGQIEFLYSK